MLNQQQCYIVFIGSDKRLTNPMFRVLLVDNWLV